MQQMFADLLRALFDPQGLPSSGTIAVWALVVMVIAAVIKMIWEAFGDERKALILRTLATWPRRVFVAAWTIFMFSAAYNKSTLMFVSAIIASPMLARLRLQRNLSLWIVAVTSIAVMGGSFAVNRWLFRLERAQLRVYFVLPFRDQNHSGAAVDKGVLDSWADCKRTLKDVFSELSWLRIDPQSFDFNAYVLDKNEEEREMDRIKDHGVLPDAVLVTDIAIFDSSGDATFVPEIARPVRNRLVVLAPSPTWLQRSRIDDEKHVSFVISAWVWQWLEKEYPDRVLPGDAAKVNKRIRELYLDFLRTRQQPQSELVDEVNKSSDTDDAIRALLGAYHSLVSSPDAAGALAVAARNERVAISGLGGVRQ
jgi:hypothetical protein